MLGPSDRQFLPKIYIETRKNRYVIPRWLKAAGYIFLGLPLVMLIVLTDYLPVFLISIGFLLSIVYFLNKRLLVRMLVRHRGRICPCCWRASDQPKSGCSGCHAPAGPASHRIYWRLARIHDAAAEQWFADLFRVQEMSAPWTRKVLLFIVVLISVPIFIVLATVVMTVYFNDLSWMDNRMGGIWFWVFVIPGGWISVYFAKHRAGTTLHCAKCDYQMVPKAKTPKHCPECGTNLNVKDAIAHGKSIGSHWHTVVWSAVLILFFLGFIVSGLPNNFGLSPSRMVPTQKLVDHVITSPDVDYAVWGVIESRRLSDQQIMQLLDEIEARLGQGEPIDDADLWDFRVSQMIEQESVNRKLGKAIELRLLRLHETQEHCPSTISLWVRDAIDRGVYTQAEIQAAQTINEQDP